MAADDHTYFRRRIDDEEAAARAATHPAARARHLELASIYRMRIQYLSREARGEPPPAFATLDAEPFLAAPKPLPEVPAVPRMKMPFS
jgi:hypothetical protein